MTLGYSRYRVLRLDHFEFCEAWAEEANHHQGGWVPMRLIRLPSTVMFELRKAGLIEIEDNCARPVRWP